MRTYGKTKDFFKAQQQKNSQGNSHARVDASAKTNPFLKSAAGAKQKNQNTKTGARAGAQSDNQIISGYFLDEKPYKELIIQRVNNFLYCVLGLLVVFCLVCYYFVSCKEVQLNKISRETLELNYENDDLQTKLDSLQSYYNIDEAVSKANILERARRVVEVDAIDLPNLDLEKAKRGKHTLVVSY